MPELVRNCPRLMFFVGDRLDLSAIDFEGKLSTNRGGSGT